MPAMPQQCLNRRISCFVWDLCLFNFWRSPTAKFTTPAKHLCTTYLEAAGVTIPQGGPAAASLRLSALDVQRYLCMLDWAPDLFVDNDNLSAPPHEPEEDIKDDVWDNILQGNKAADIKSLVLSLETWTAKQYRLPLFIDSSEIRLNQWRRNIYPLANRPDPNRLGCRAFPTFSTARLQVSGCKTCM